MLDYIDELLKSHKREMTCQPEYIMCGSTGNRVYGCFSKKPGLCGIYHFVHKSDLADLLELDFKNMALAVKINTVYEWRPSYLYMKHTYPCFIIEEKKFITRNDYVVSQVRIKSLSGKIKFKLGLKSSFFDKSFEKELVLFNQKIKIKAFCSDSELLGSKYIQLEKGSELCFAICCGFRTESEEWTAEIPSLEKHRTEYGEFFKGIPILSCSDKDIEKVYYYRWFLLRHHISDPKLGFIKYPILYEGRHGYFYEPEINTDEVVNWEFSKGILASSSHHILDMRWHENLEYIKGEVLNYTESFGKMKQFLEYKYEVPLLPGCISIHDFTGHYFFHLMPLMAWNIYERSGDREWLEKVEPSLWSDLQNWSSFDSEDSVLPMMVYEGDSAMEFGPASHYYSKKLNNRKVGEKQSKLEVGTACNYETDNAGWGSPMPNRRTEVASFFGLNYYAFHKIYKILGDKNKEKYCLKRYESIKDAINDYMWSDKYGFFMELDSEFQKISDVKQVGGIFCLFLTDPGDPERFLENLTDTEKFNQKFGIASTSKDSFGYFPNNTVNGVRAHTCMWNGPTWPYSTSFALLAAGQYIKRLKDGRVKDQYTEFFKNEFMKYTKLYFMSGNKEGPCLVEHYNCETGDPLSGQDDYNHSCYIDIFIRIVCGLEDNGAKVNFSPIYTGMGYIKLDKVILNGISYSVEIIDKHAVLYGNGNKIKEIWIS